MLKKVVIFTLALMVCFSSYWVGYSLSKERDAIYKELDIFAEGLSIVKEKYVEDKPTQEMIYGAVSGLMNSLDSYSQFLDPDEYNELLVETEGKFGGLGIEITIRDTLLTVVSPIEDTPAWIAGLKAGDIIIKIDGEITKGITLTQAVKKLRGEPGTEVTLTVLRDKTRKIEDVTVVRGIIKIKDIKRAQILEDGIGYLRIAEFRETTDRDLSKTLAELKEAGLSGIIIDVRNNPGGLLDSAIKISSIFVKDGETVVSTKSRTQKERIYGAVPMKVKVLDIPAVVLINKGSASASEILAAALRDNKRAILLGETTFGKGSVQTIIPLSDGSALRLTTSKYYTPAGISIHEKGIKPDIVVEEQEIEEKKSDVFDNLEKTDDKFDYKKDYQIVRALDLIRGLKVLH